MARRSATTRKTIFAAVRRIMIIIIIIILPDDFGGVFLPAEHEFLWRYGLFLLASFCHHTSSYCTNIVRRRTPYSTNVVSGSCTGQYRRGRWFELLVRYKFRHNYLFKLDNAWCCFGKCMKISCKYYWYGYGIRAESIYYGIDIGIAFCVYFLSLV